MAIVVACGGCGKIYNVSAAVSGKRVKCKACGTAFTVVPVASNKPILRPAVAGVVLARRPCDWLSE